MVELLLRKGAQPNGQSFEDFRPMDPVAPLTEAARKGHSHVVRLLISWTGINADLVGFHEERLRPLPAACHNGHGDVVDILLESGMCDINLRSGWRKTTPLMEATTSGNTTIVRQLLASPGLDLEVEDEEGRTALSIAVCQDYFQITDLLLDCGASYDARSWDYSGEFPSLLLHAAHEHKSRFLRSVIQDAPWDLLRAAPRHESADQHGGWPGFHSSSHSEGRHVGLRHGHLGCTKMETWPSDVAGKWCDC